MQQRIERTELPSSYTLVEDETVSMQVVIPLWDSVIVSDAYGARETSPEEDSQDEAISDVSAVKQNWKAGHLTFQLGPEACPDEVLRWTRRVLEPIYKARKPIRERLQNSKSLIIHRTETLELPE
jgi:hypothetical protein